MDTLTLEQLKVASAAGGVAGAKVQASNGQLIVKIETKRGFAVLAKARSHTPRTFRSTGQAFKTLIDAGVTVGTFDLTGFNPDLKVSIRPDRSEAMKQVHKDAGYDEWFTGQVVASIEDPRDSISNADAQALFSDRRKKLKGIN